MIDLRSLVRSLWNGRLRILLSATFFFLLAVAYLIFIASPIYRATSVVALESREASVAGLDSVIGGLSAESIVVVTEAEVLRGRMLMGRVVDQLNLTENPEYNQALAAPGLMARLKSMLRAAPSTVIDPQVQALRQREATISTLLDSVKIQPVPLSLVFRITATSQDAETAAAVADAVAHQYVMDQHRVRYDAAQTAARWLTGQLSDLQETLEQAEAEARRFQTSTALIDANTLAAIDRQLKDTRYRRDQGGQQLQQLEAKLQSLLAAPDHAAAAQISADAGLLRLLANGLASEDERAGFENRLAVVMQDLRQQISRLSDQNTSLDAAITSLEANIARQSQDLIHLEQLNREAQSNRLLYEQLQTRLKETSAQMGIPQADSRILSAAVTPFSPASPRKGLLLVAALMLGGLLGSLIVLISELQSRRLRSRQEAEAATGLQVMAQVPLAPGRQKTALLESIRHNPAGLHAEALRNLRTSVQLSSIETTPQIIMMSSALPSEGKTSLTAALAHAYTALGRRVLLIDCDIRRRGLSKLMGREALGPGLIALLRGEVSAAQAITALKDSGSLLAAEEYSVHAADLFSSQNFRNLLEALRNDYDLILIDTPPVLLIPDAKVIGQYVDATLLVVSWNSTYRDQVREALEEFRAVNISVTGMVLNQIRSEGMPYYAHSEYKPY